MIALTDYLITEYEANIRFNGDEITLLGDTLTLGIDEAIEANGYISTGMKERFQKSKVKNIKWESHGNRYFPNVFSRALAAKTYLVSQVKHLLLNATLVENSLRDKQKLSLNM